MSGYICKNCGESATMAFPAGAPAPACACGVADWIGPMSAVMPVSGDMTASAIHHSEALLLTARGLLEDQPELAIVVAQTATEVETERVFTRLLQSQGGTAFEKSISDLFSAYTFSNDRFYKVFKALTDVVPESLFARLKKSAKLRHEIVHAGAKVASVDAEESLSASGELIRLLIEMFS